MVKITSKKQNSRVRPSSSCVLRSIALLFVCLVVVVPWLFQAGFESDEGSVVLSPLLSLAGGVGITGVSDTSITVEKRKIVFDPVPPTKIPVVVETPNGKKLHRNNVISNIKMGVMVDWLIPTDWDAPVGTHDGQQHFHGYYGLTPDGRPAWIPEPYLHYKSETKTEKTLHHAHFSFNKWRSDQLPLSLPRVDLRSRECLALSKSYQKMKLPNTSVIFVAYNEPFSTLFRSIHSVLDRTPPHLLHEIILVDDGSEVRSFGEDLETYIALLPKTKLFRLPKRKGLMAARTYGAEQATGDTLTFLDSHIEALQGWLPPLLERIAVNRRHVTVPVIDQIDADTWEYTQGGISILGFSWSLGQVGVSRKPPANKTDPMPSPVMAGGLFTIDRKWFFELGAYDPELQFWGGEEMEISFKIWQCGGHLECIPCSGVGHVFRSSKHWKGRVYEVPPGMVSRNRLRTAAVWMDPKHWELVQNSIPPLQGNMSIGDLSQMKAIRTKLKCKSFQWYLDTAYPELFFPDMKNFLWAGEVRHLSSNKCLDTMGRKAQKEPLGVFPCHGQGGNQQFAGSKFHEIRVPHIGWEFCVDANAGVEHKEAILYPCHGGEGAQKWELDTNTKQLQAVGMCLTYQGGERATMEKCTAGNTDQIWAFIDKREKKASP